MDWFRANPTKEKPTSQWQAGTKLKLEREGSASSANLVPSGGDHQGKGPANNGDS